jgi:hypothetical protein
MEDTLNKKRFLWGLLLAWAPWVPTVIGIGYLFVGLSDSKATGLAVVVGGMVELLVWWGIATMIISQVAAIVWLFRSFSGAHIPRSLIAAVSIFASGLMLFLVFTFLFWGRRFLEQATSP